jgi:hypothetical protein
LFSGSLEREACVASFLVDRASGRVVNIVVLDAASVASGWEPPSDLVLVEFDGPCDIGWTWDGMVMIEPDAPEVVPIVPATTTTVL